MEFEKENDVMDQRQEMMDDAIDDVTGLEDEEEGDEVVNKVLDEIGVDLGQAVSVTVDENEPFGGLGRLGWIHPRWGRIGSFRLTNRCRWAKHQRDYKRLRFPTAESLKQ